MNSTQYEELCRFFLANKLGTNIESIRSVSIPNPKRPSLPEYNHQIDLYWETGNDVTSYLNIANAKWRRSDKVDQPDVMLLQQVRQKVAAHKAVMITNSGFTSGAEAVAKDEGIALHIVRPNFKYLHLPRTDRVAIQQAIKDIALGTNLPVYTHETHLKALDIDAADYLAEIEPILKYASEQESFMVRTLSRRLRYLEWLVGLIREGSYGKEEDVPGFQLEIIKTKQYIDQVVAKIKRPES